MPMAHTVNHTFSNEAFIDEVIAECDGDMREAIKALLLVNEQLETELQQLYVALEHDSPSEHRLQRLLH
jgi:acetyl-CoA carboxylase alpha subunit